MYFTSTSCKMIKSAPVNFTFSKAVNGIFQSCETTEEYHKPCFVSMVPACISVKS